MNSPVPSSRSHRLRRSATLAAVLIAARLLVLGACGEPPRDPLQVPATAPPIVAAQPSRPDTQTGGANGSDDGAGRGDTPVARDADRTVRVSFARGANAASVADTLAAFALHDYVVRASAGQRLSARLHTVGPALLLVIENAGYTPRDFETVEPDRWDDAGEPGYTWDGVLPRTGEYRVRVAHSGPAANWDAVSAYALTIQID